MMGRITGMVDSVKLWNPRMVGLLVSAVVGTAVIVAFSASVISFGTNNYTAEFARSGGAQAGDEVRIAGVGVGKVTGVELDGNKVVVSFVVDDGARLGEASHAEIKLATLLGNTYLEVNPEGPGTLQDNRIPLARTKVTFDLQNAIEAGGTALGQLDAKEFRLALQAMSEAFRDTPPSVRLTLDGLGDVSRELAGRRDEIAQLIRSSSAVVTSLNSRSADIIELMKQSDLLLDELLDRRQALHALIKGTRLMATQLSGVLADNEVVVGPMLARLEVVVDMLEKRSDDIDRGLAALAPAVRYYTNVTGNGPWAEGRLPYLSPDNALCRTGVISPCS